jgi:hypothetical protein
MVQDMNLLSILIWGFVATTTLTTIILTGQSVGVTRLDIPFVVGTMFTPDRDRAKVIGYVVHVLNGWIFAIAYAMVFENLHRATWWIGGILGLLQGLIVVIGIIPLLPGVHPRMVSDSRGPEPTRLLEPPGFLLTNYGRFTPLVTVFAHAIYGLILGAFYQLS